MDRRIPGLPIEWITVDGRTIDLSLVPDGPASEFDKERARKVAEWRAWKNEVIRYRAYIRMHAERNEDLQRWELAKCRQSSTLYYPTVYGWIFEPRSGGLLPAIPYPFQVDYVNWMDDRAKGVGADSGGPTSKSRDMGATWWACLRGCGKFLFEDTYVLKLISRKEDLVDDPGNMDSMMERIVVNIERLPSWLRPVGWSRKQHKQKLKITRPDNQNAIIGESTSAKSGRGGRSTEAYVDEAALIDDFMLLLGSLMQTAGHVFPFSSEYVGVSEEFLDYREAMEKQYPKSVFVMDHWMHPEHDAVWLEQQKERYINNEAGFQAEIMRNPWGGNEELVYPMAQNIQLLPEYVAYVDGNPLDICMDPGRDDACAMHWIMHIPETGRDLVLESFESSHLPPGFYAAIALGCNLDPAAHDPSEGFPSFGLSDREIERYNVITEWTRSLPQCVIYGDPAGSQNHAGESWYEKMQEFALKHNPRKDNSGNPRPLVILYSWKNKDRHFSNPERGRRVAMMEWLERLDFNNTPEVERTLLAVKKSRFEPQKERMTEQRIPVHNWASHRRTALEFGAVNLDYAREVAAMDLKPYIPGAD